MWKVGEEAICIKSRKMNSAEVVQNKTYIVREVRIRMVNGEQDVSLRVHRPKETPKGKLYTFFGARRFRKPVVVEDFAHDPVEVKIPELT